MSSLKGVVNCLVILQQCVKTLIKHAVVGKNISHTHTHTHYFTVHMQNIIVKSSSTEDVHATVQNESVVYGLHSRHCSAPI